MNLRTTAILGVVLISLVAGTGSATTSTDRTDNQADGFVVDGCTTVVQSGKYILDSDLTAEDRDFCLIVEDAQDVILDARNHTIHGELRAAVYVIRSRNVTIRNIVSNDTRRAGIHVEKSEDVLVEGNTVKHTRRAVTLRHSENLHVRDNLIQGVGLRDESGIDSGISFRHSQDITIEHNQIFGTASAVSITNSSEILARGNLLERNVYGFQMRKFSHDIVVRSNVIRNHSLCPMDVKNSSDILIDDNYMEQHAGLGLEINASYVTISDNVLKDSTEFGIDVATGSRHVTITNNTVVNSSRHAGVRVYGSVSDVMISGNTIANNTPTGILVKEDAFRITIRNNSIIGNDGTGILIRPRVRDVRVTGNLLLGNSEKSIDSGVSDGVVIENNRQAEDTEAEGDDPIREDTPVSEHDESLPNSSPNETPGQPGFGALSAALGFVLFAFLTARCRSRQ